MSKFLCLGNHWKCGNEVADEVNICNAIEAEGHEVFRYNKFEVDKIWEDKPQVDVTLTWKGMEFNTEFLKKLRELNPGKPIYFIQHDNMEAHPNAKTREERSPVSLPTQHMQQAKECDAYFSKETGWRRDYEDAGVNFIYWPEDACPVFYKKADLTDPEELHRCELLKLTEEVYPVVFSATWTDLGMDRPKYIQPIADALPLTIFSMNWDAWVDHGFKAQAGMWDESYCLLIAKSKINLAIDWRHDIEGYWSDRIAQILGAGGFVLAKYTLGMERSFGPDKEHLVYWNDQAECIEKANYYLEHEDERKQIAYRGHEYCLKYMKFDYRVKQFLTILKYHLEVI